MTFTKEQLPKILEAALMASGQPLSIDQMLSLFFDDQQPSRDEIREALSIIAEACEERGVELKQVGSGYRFQAKQDYAQWIARLWEEKPPRYSRALLETLALVAYRQPITRGEIEDVRGVSVSSHIIKTLLEREWVRVVGHRDVPGKPALYATTKHFLDYFNIKSLEELPTLQEIRDLDKINAELDLAEPDANEPSDQEGRFDSDGEIATQQDVETQTAEEDIEQDQFDMDSELQQIEASTEFADADDADIDQHDIEQDAVEEIEALQSEDDSDETNKDVDVVVSSAEVNENNTGNEAQSDEEEESEEMLYADGHDDIDDNETIDDKYADTSASHSITEPDEPHSAISDAADTSTALKT